MVIAFQWLTADLGMGKLNLFSEGEIDFRFHTDKVIKSKENG